MITPIQGVLWLAVLAGLAALGAHAWSRDRATRLVDVFARAHVGALLAALLLLLVAFLASDFSYAYVWAHSHVDHALAYKVSGLWGGEEGTVLLWASLAGVFALLVLRRGDVDTGMHRRAALLILGFTTILAAIPLLAGGFGPLAPDRLALAPRGRGLADVLLTPLMVIHPPVQFVAYALLTPVGAYALAHALRPAPGWIHPAYLWARVAWLAGTLGLGLGALWAYYVLSFGGYWAWDPVETSNLLPWLALTAFLHAGKHLQRHGDHVHAAPLLAFLAFLLTLFATFATRSGLWVSVHAFTDPTDRFEPDAGLRLLAILDAHAPTRLFLGLLTFVALAGISAFLLHHAPRLAAPARRLLQAHAVLLLAFGGAALLDPTFAWGLLLRVASFAPSLGAGLGLLALLLLGLPLALPYLLADEVERKSRGVDVRTLMSIAVALFAIATGVAFLLNMQVVNRSDRILFDQRAPFLALPLASVLTVMLALAPLGRRNALLLAASGLALGAISWSLFPGARVLALSAPILLAGLLAAILRLRHVQGHAAPRPLAVAGGLLLAASLLGLVFWSNPPTRFGAIDISPHAGVPLGIMGLALSFAGLLGAYALLRGKGATLALAGAACATLAAGYALGALLALAALVLALRHRAAFTALAWRKEGARLRETGVWLVHLAVLLGLLGYAGSTYSQDRDVFPAAPMDAEAHLGAHHFLLHPHDAQADAQGRLDALTVPISVTKGGRDAGGAALRFTWEGDRYHGHLDVRRHLLEDVYVTPLAFHAGGPWVGADSASGKVPADVTAVSFAVSVIPLVGLVWAGLWIGLLGMALGLAGSVLARRAGTETRALHD